MAASVLVAALALIGCGEKTPISKKLPSQEGKRVMRSWSDSTPLEIHLGSTTFHVPYNKIQYEDQERFSGPGPYIADGSFGFGFTWPTMGGSGDIPPCSADRCVTGRISNQLEIYGAKILPLHDPRDYEVSPARRVKLPGPFINTKLGLREWRNTPPVGKGIPIIFGYLDPTYRTPEGREPLARCAYSWEAKSPKPLRCHGSGQIGNKFLYVYHFDPRLLREWPAIDAATRKLLESFIVQGD